MSRSKRAPTWWASCSLRRRRGMLLSSAAHALGLAVRERAQKVALTVDADDALLDAVVEALQAGYAAIAWHRVGRTGRAALAHVSACR